MFNNAFNHGKRFDFDSSKLEYINLDNYVQDGYPNYFVVKGMFITKSGKFGPRGIIVSEAFNIQVPKHLNADISDILSNYDMIDAINEGKCGAKVYQYTDKNGVKRNSIRFVDIEEVKTLTELGTTERN